MTNQDLETIIVKAIQEKKTIHFQYNKSGKIVGERIGNPYAIYWNGDETKKYLDLHQISGVSDSVLDGKSDLPHWVTLESEFISDIEMSDEIFQPNADYKRYSKRFMIANIKI